MAEKIAIVTGANKGIGFEIVRALAQSVGSDKLKCIVACRDEQRCKAAVDKLRKEFPSKEFHQGSLDLARTDSIKEFASQIKSQYGRVDILVHNAAIAFKGSDPTPFRDQARPTLSVNYFGTLALNTELLPLVKRSDHGNVVFVASQSGTSAYKGLNENLKKRWRAVHSVEQINELVNKFISDVESGQYKQEGWPESCYGVSKLAVIALAKTLAKQNPNITVNSVCPGWCSTDMSSHSGPRSAEKGAETPAYLATFGAGNVSGEFWYDKEVISFL